jgi:hypothetical protein
MKKQLFFSIAFIMSALFSFAQDDMPIVWEARMDHKI